MRLVAISLAVSASLIAGAALADSTPQPNPPKKSGFDPKNVVCKTIGQTGSHLPGERVCLTEAEWEQQSEQDQKTVGGITTQRVGAAASGGFSAGGADGGGGGAGGRMR